MAMTKIDAENIIDAISPADLYRIDLINIKFLQGLSDMSFGKRSLVILV